jgi:hypothetical protein
MLVDSTFYIRFIAWSNYDRHLTEIIIQKLTSRGHYIYITALIILGSGLCVLVILRLFRRDGTQRRVMPTLILINCILVEILMRYGAGFRREKQFIGTYEHRNEFCTAYIEIDSDLTINRHVETADIFVKPE